MDVATLNWPLSLPSESITPPSQNWQCTSIPMYCVAVDLAVVLVFVAMSRLLLPDTRPTRGQRRQRSQTTQPRTSYIFRRRHYKTRERSIHEHEFIAPQDHPRI